MAFDMEGHKVTETRIEEAYKGNYHLHAVIDGKPCKYVIRIGTEDHSLISSSGMSRIPENLMKSLIGKYLLKH